MFSLTLVIWSVYGGIGLNKGLENFDDEIPCLVSQIVRKEALLGFNSLRLLALLFRLFKYYS